jgi:hypothetical protein
MRKSFGGEDGDLRTLALAAVVVPATWWLFLGWRWPQTLGAHDELAQNLLAIREIVRSGDGWSSLVYRADLLGGAKWRDVVGPFPLFPLLAAAGLSPTAVSAVAALLVQSLLGFLGCRAAEDVAGAWSGAPRRLTVWERTGLLWLAAFAPALGWRLGYGHLNLLVGLLPFAAGLALLAASALERLSVTLVVVATAAIVLGLLHSGQQIVLCGLVFGAPVLAGVWLALGGVGRRLLPPLAVAAGAVLIALPGLWPMIVQARSSDSPRGLGEAVVTYDFVTSTAVDWLSSVPWTTAALPGVREASLLHEVNYPVGPLVLLTVLVPWRRSRTLAFALVLSLAAILAFSMDITPLSRPLLALVPPLRSFRVPGRAILPWLYVLSVLASAALLAKDTPPPAGPENTGARPKRGQRARGEFAALGRGRAVAAALVVAAALFLAPSLLREAGAWALAVAVVALAVRRRPGLPAVAVLLVLGAGSVGAFRERLLPFEDGERLLAEASRMGEALRRAKPDLGSALSRARLDLEIRAFTVNTAFAAGVSSLDAYAIPTRRFAALLFALRGVRYEPTAVFFKLGADEPAFRALRQLYDVVWLVSLPARGSLSVSPAKPAAGPAWFSRSLSHLPDTAALARELLVPADELYARVSETVWVVDADPLPAPAALAAGVDPTCAAARLETVDAPIGAPKWTARVEAVEAECPLVFASNFTEDLRAEVVSSGGRHGPAPVFPAYGALAGVVVPAGTREVRLFAEPPLLPWSVAWPIAGCALCAASLVLGRGSGPSRGDPGAGRS